MAGALGRSACGWCRRVRLAILSLLRCFSIVLVLIPHPSPDLPPTIAVIVILRHYLVQA